MHQGGLEMHQSVWEIWCIAQVTLVHLLSKLRQVPRITEENCKDLPVSSTILEKLNVHHAWLIFSPYSYCHLICPTIQSCQPVQCSRLASRTMVEPYCLAVQLCRPCGIVTATYSSQSSSSRPKVCEPLKGSTEEDDKYICHEATRFLKHLPANLSRMLADVCFARHESTAADPKSCHRSSKCRNA